MKTLTHAIILAATLTLTCSAAAKTVKPALHGQNWVAVTGKPAHGLRAIPEETEGLFLQFFQQCLVGQGGQRSG